MIMDFIFDGFSVNRNWFHACVNASWLLALNRQTYIDNRHKKVDFYDGILPRFNSIKSYQGIYILFLVFLVAVALSGFDGQ